MTPEEKERMNELCRQIQVEKDPQKFTELVSQLSALLDRKSERLHVVEPPQNRKP